MYFPIWHTKFLVIYYFKFVTYNPLPYHFFSWPVLFITFSIQYKFLFSEFNPIASTGLILSANDSSPIDPTGLLLFLFFPSSSFQILHLRYPSFLRLFRNPIESIGSDCFEIIFHQRVQFFLVDPVEPTGFHYFSANLRLFQEKPTASNRLDLSHHTLLQSNPLESITIFSVKPIESTGFIHYLQH